MHFKALPLLTLTSLLLAACGGGSNSTSPVQPPTNATVTNISADRLMYGGVTRLTVKGQNLDQGITLTPSPATACNRMTEEAGGSSTQRVFTCTPGLSGPLMVTATHTSTGTTLSAVGLTIPTPQVSLKTSMGDMVLELYPNNAPITVYNFLQYVAANFYTNLIFHRVVPGFVIQGGGFNSSLQQATTRSPIKLEVPNGLSNVRGSVAMARTAVADSATSQFYINLVDNITLDTTGGGYAVFGKVISGLAVVDAIASVPTGTVSGTPNVPLTPVVITAATQTQ